MDDIFDTVTDVARHARFEMSRRCNVDILDTYVHYVDILPDGFHVLGAVRLAPALGQYISITFAGEDNKT